MREIICCIRDGDFDAEQAAGLLGEWIDGDTDELAELLSIRKRMPTTGDALALLRHYLPLDDFEQCESECLAARRSARGRVG